jgi:hypothetical protein
LLGIPIHLKLFVPRGFADTLRKFVKDHGLDPKFDARKILEYGLVQESDEELERLERERCQPSSEVHTNYAITKFKAYENLVNNKALTLKLQFLVSENERLKRILLEKGLIDSIETEWTKEKINEFQEKYLFGQKTSPVPDNSSNSKDPAVHVEGHRVNDEA